MTVESDGMTYVRIWKDGRSVTIDGLTCLRDLQVLIALLKHERSRLVHHVEMEQARQVAEASRRSE